MPRLRTLSSVGAANRISLPAALEAPFLPKNSVTQFESLDEAPGMENDEDQPQHPQQHLEENEHDHYAAMQQQSKDVQEDGASSDEEEYGWCSSSSFRTLG